MSVHIPRRFDFYTLIVHYLFHHRGFWKCFATLYAALLAGMLLIPQPVVEVVTTEALRGSSRLIHFVLFVPLGGGIVPLTGRYASPVARSMIAVLGATLYGALLEWLQALLPALQRSFSWRDILANGLGSAAGAIAVTLLLRTSRQRYPGADGRRPPHPVLMR